MDSKNKCGAQMKLNSQKVEIHNHKQKKKKLNQSTFQENEPTEKGVIVAVLNCIY